MVLEFAYLYTLIMLLMPTKKKKFHTTIVLFVSLWEKHETIYYGGGWGGMMWDERRGKNRASRAHRDMGARGKIRVGP